MSADKQSIPKPDANLSAFVQEVTASLLEGKRHQTPGLGTFSTCTRKSTADRAACTMAMFRASNDLREYIIGGPPPSVSGLHSDAVIAIIEAMQTGQGICLPNLGHMAVVPVPGKKPKLIFHGADVLNDVLSGVDAADILKR